MNVMTKKIAFFLLLLPFLSFAQQQSVVVPWQDQAQIKPGETSQQLRTLGTMVSIDGYRFYKQWQDDQIVDPNSLQISNVRYVPLSQAERNILDTENIPTAPQATISTAVARDIRYTVLSITPVVNLNGQYQKVVSFNADYGYTAFAGAKNSSLPISNSVLATGSWYKFKVEQTGVYRLTKSFLNTLGMNTDGIDPRTIKIYGHGGQPLPRRNSENDAFDLPQVAIQVIGEEDGSFDNSDVILFYGVSTRGYIPDLDTNINPYSDRGGYFRHALILKS